METFISLALLAVAGCASLAVTDQALTERTAGAVGLKKTGFTVSQRMDDSTRTRSAVRKPTGQEFNCFVGGSFNVLGRSVSNVDWNQLEAFLKSAGVRFALGRRSEAGAEPTALTPR